MSRRLILINNKMAVPMSSRPCSHFFQIALGFVSIIPPDVTLQWTLNEIKNKVGFPIRECRQLPRVAKKIF